MIGDVEVAVVFTNRRRNGTSENIKSHRQLQNDQNEVDRLISQLQLGIYFESRMRISFKIVYRSRDCVAVVFSELTTVVRSLDQVIRFSNHTQS